MADQYKKLLVKLTLDNKEFMKAISQIRSDLKTIHNEAKSQSEKQLVNANKQLAVIKLQIAEEKNQQAQAKTLLEIDRAKAQWAKQEQEKLVIKLKTKALETAEVKKQQLIQSVSFKLEQDKFRLYQQQLRIQQQLTKEHERQSKAVGGSGILGHLGGAVNRLMGGGMMGAVAGGALAGGLLGGGAVQLVEMLADKVHELGRALMEASGPAQQMRIEFERLSHMRGVDPSVLLDKLRTSTRGLVEDMSLFRMANNFLKSDLKVSTDQMTKLIENTLNLGRSMGKSSNEISRALEMAFLNPQRGLMRLARVTGISVELLRQGFAGLPRSVDPATRSLIMFNTLMEQEERMLKKVGVPITTLPELLHQASNASKNFMDAIAQGILKGGSFGKTIEDISKWLIELGPQIEKTGVWIGDKLAGAFELGKYTVRAFAAEFNLLWSVLTGILGQVRSFSLSGMTHELTHGKSAVSEFKIVIGDLALLMENMAFQTGRTGKLVKLFFDLIRDNSSVEKMQKDVENTTAALAELNKQHEQHGKEIKAYVFGTNAKPESGDAGSGSQGMSTAQRNKLIDTQKKLDQLTNQIQLESFKHRIAEEEEALKESYDRRRISLEEYLHEQKKLLIEQRDAELEEIDKNRTVQLHAARAKGTAIVNGTPVQVTNSQELKKTEELINKEAELNKLKVAAHTEHELAALRKQGREDELRAEMTHIKELSDLQAKGLQEQQALLEKQYSSGRMDTEEYIAGKRDLINQEYLAVDEGLKKQLLASKNNLAEEAAIEKQRADLKMNTEKQLALFDDSQDDIRLKAIERRYSLQKTKLQAETVTAQTRNKMGMSGDAIGPQQQLLAYTEQYTAELQKQLTLQTEGSDKWLEIIGKIQQAEEHAAKLSQDIRTYLDMSRTMGGVAGGIAGITGLLPGTGAQHITSVLDNMQSSSRSISNFGDAGGKSLFKELGSEFGALIHHTKGLKESFHDFGHSITGILQGVAGAVQGITGGKSAAGGALSGGMSGMQLGGQVGGPIGMAVGAVAGGIMGGIFGSKQQRLQEDLHKVQDQMQAIIDSMNQGAISLSQAIADMRQERQSAIQLLSNDPKGNKGGGKKGNYNPSQAQAAINQIDAQIAQLVDTQKQLLDQLDQQVGILSNPQPFQQYVQSLDTIIQKYQQFSSAAAGNAQAVANAQTFLNSSLQAYVTTLGQQLNQAQQSAIQDSLTLLNLEYQRQQIINQEAQQEYDILTQGVLTRQRTTAMTKGQEIGQLRYQRDMQLEQMDEQIALQQYKVQTEQQIFQLATTRVGLEMQLLTLQESQAGYQNEQTAALLQVVQELQGAMASGSLMSSIGALGSTPTGTGLLTTIMGSLGLGGYVPPGILTGVGGATNYLSQIPQPYQSITNFINNMDPNFLMNLWNAMQTPVGSSQRQSVMSEAQPYAQDAATSGYDFSGFMNWIKQSSAIQGTTATVTNSPAPIGSQPLPTGTGFAMPTGTGYSPSSIPYSSQGTLSPYDAVSGSMTALDSSTQSASLSMEQLSLNIKDVIAGIGQGYTNNTTAIPHYATGGPVTKTGLAHVDKGEYVLTEGQTNAFGMLSKGTMRTSGAHNNIVAEKATYELAMKKASTEMTVISARSSLLNGEMQHLNMLNDTIDKISKLRLGGGSAGNLEAMFQQVYETRGRYGSGTFRRTVL